ncbi:MAG: hypothetical protein ACK2UI_09300, partial [Anaerolineae bacterium]
MLKTGWTFVSLIVCVCFLVACQGGTPAMPPAATATPTAASSSTPSPTEVPPTPTASLTPTATIVPLDLVAAEARAPQVTSP